MKSKNLLASARKRGKEMTEKPLRNPKCKLISLDDCNLLRGFAMAISGRKVNFRENWWQDKYIVVEFKGKKMLPYWQSEKAVEPHLPKIIKILKAKGMKDLGMLIFFMSKNIRLAGKSPLDALRKNKVKEVLTAARCYHEHGAD